MSEFLPGVGPIHSHRQEVMIPPQVEAAVPAKPTPPLTAEQIRARDAALAQERDDDNAAALFGVWAGTMLLKDLAEEHFHVPADEDEPGPRPKDKPELPR